MGWSLACVERGASDDEVGEETAGTETEGCTDGNAGCPCYGNGTCNDELVCTDDMICAPVECVDGSVGCPCYGNGTCDDGLQCNESNLCEPVDGDSESTSESTSDSTSESSDTGVPPSCGDGNVDVDEGEACDDGNIQDGDGCTAECMLESCGDGVVQMGEECDDGNMVDTDACLDECTDAACGDGTIQLEVEECDDGGTMSGDGCSSICDHENKRVFVTSTLHDGDLGGLAGADAICNTRAQEANLPGTYMAWVSTDAPNGTPATRFTQSTQAYVRTDGVTVANDWSDLVDGSLDNPINVTETGEAPPLGNVTCGQNDPTAWTGTSADGTLQGNYTCNNWTDTAGSALWGRTTVTNVDWSQWCAGGPCNWVATLYCFQQ
jgi:cysteine-rich repeat protein